MRPSRRSQRAARREPILQNRVTTYAIVAVSVLVLALLAPLFARGWTISLLLLVLVIVGVEVVRNIVLREAPQQT